MRRFAEAVPVGYGDLKYLCEDRNELHLFLLKSGLLGDFSGLCDSCKVGHLNLTKNGDEFYWRCGYRTCRKKISLRKDSFFEGSHLENSTILCLIYCWLYELSYKFVKADLKIASDSTICDWYNFCRDVCVEILLKDNKKIGGSGHIVEIDESRFGKRKFNRGRSVDGC